MEGLKNRDNELESILRNLISDYGIGLFEDEKKFNALFMDYAPKLRVERQLIVSALHFGAYSELKSVAAASELVKQDAFRRCVHRLKSETLIADDSAALAVTLIAKVMGIQDFLPPDMSAANQTGIQVDNQKEPKSVPVTPPTPIVPPAPIVPQPPAPRKRKPVLPVVIFSVLILFIVVVVGIIRGRGRIDQTENQTNDDDYVDDAGVGSDEEKVMSAEYGMGILFTSDLELHEEPDAESSVLTSYTCGTLTSYYEHLTGWYEIPYESGSAYVPDVYVREVSVDETVNGIVGVVKAIAEADIRSGPDIDSEYIGKLDINQKAVFVDRLSNGWFEIINEGQHAYVPGDQVEVSFDNETINYQVPQELLPHAQGTRQFRTLLQGSIAAGATYTVAIRNDSTMVGVGCDTSHTGDYDITDLFSDMGFLTYIEGGQYNVIAVSRYGTAEIISVEADGAFYTNEYFNSFARWEEIMSIASGCCAIAAFSDGTVSVLPYGHLQDEWYWGDITHAAATWKDVMEVDAGGSNVVALFADGHVDAAGDNSYYQCEVDSWEGVSDIAAGLHHTVGLLQNGTVVACGDNSAGQCNTESWTDIIAVCAGDSFTLGLKSDGTVVATGDNSYGQCNVSDWNDITEIAAGSNHSVGLRSDGTAVAVGDNSCGQCEVSAWNGLGVL